MSIIGRQLVRCYAARDIDRFHHTPGARPASIASPNVIFHSKLDKRFAVAVDVVRDESYPDQTEQDGLEAEPFGLRATGITAESFLNSSNHCLREIDKLIE